MVDSRFTPEQQKSVDNLSESIKKNDSADNVKNQIASIPEKDRLAICQAADAQAHQGAASANLPHLEITGTTENELGEQIPKKVVYHHDRTDILKDVPIVGGKTWDDTVYEDRPNPLQMAAREFQKAKKPAQEAVNETISNAYNPGSKQQN